MGDWCRWFLPVEVRPRGAPLAVRPVFADSAEDLARPTVEGAAELQIAESGPRWAARLVVVAEKPPAIGEHAILGARVINAVAPDEVGDEVAVGHRSERVIEVGVLELRHSQ